MVIDVNVKPNLVLNFVGNNSTTVDTQAINLQCYQDSETIDNIKFIDDYIFAKC